MSKRFELEAVGVDDVHALVAQWIEHQTSNLGVAGSSPARGTLFG